VSEAQISGFGNWEDERTKPSRDVNHETLEILSLGHSEGSYHRRLREELSLSRPHFEISGVEELGLV
jgi:hypothetical protein